MRSERLREAAEDAILQVRPRRAVRPPDAEVDAREAVGSRGEGRAHLARGATQGGRGDQQRELVGELAGPEEDLALAEDPDVARDEADDGSPEHVAGEDEVDGALLEPEIAQEGQIQRGGDGAQHRKIMEPAVADLRVTFPGGPLGGAGEARPSLEPAAQAPAAERGQEALRAGVLEVDRDGVAGRPRQADRGLASQRALRELAAEGIEGQVAAAEAERGGELPDLDPLGDLERRDGELSLAGQRAADPRERRHHLDAGGPDQRPSPLARHHEGAAAEGQAWHDDVEGDGMGSGGSVSVPPAEARRPGCSRAGTRGARSSTRRVRSGPG